MTTFEVQDMTCGHCVSSITQAVTAMDPGAKVTADLAAHRVEIESAVSDNAKLSAAIREAGYTAVSLDGADATKARQAPRASCCCK